MFHSFFVWSRLSAAVPPSCMHITLCNMTLQLLSTRQDGYFSNPEAGCGCGAHWLLRYSQIGLELRLGTYLCIEACPFFLSQDRQAKKPGSLP